MDIISIFGTNIFRIDQINLKRCLKKKKVISSGLAEEVFLK
jgi:hypothetical protein